ncbi:MAG: hypothetical protein KC425_01780 [Anaerolineales bacterium]|nr:hypothetical protein [Anaerolineales bacterium]
MRRLSWIVGFIWLLMLAALACTVPGIEPAGPAATPTPLGDTLSFTIPAFTMNLDEGDTIPGTQLTYVAREGDTYQVTIDGLAAQKRAGDSFIWSGLLAPGVFGSYNLRLTTAVFGSLPVAGPVEVTVFYPAPVSLETLPDLPNALTFRNTVINYYVPPGRVIPGTTLVYEQMLNEGEGDQQTRQAQFSGLTGYPYLAVGDSLPWRGQLRDNVYIEYGLRILSISEEGIRVAGFANLWVIQP